MSGGFLRSTDDSDAAEPFPMSYPLRRLLALFTLLSCVGVTHAEPRPLVVELFTSEGCSSCPPAEAYVGKLSARSDILALSFHVDYWDDLGWRDRYALPQSAARQSVYARNLGRSEVYTPQLVVDGREDNVGSDGTAIARALKENRENAPLSASLRDTEVLVELGAYPRATPSEVVLIAYLRRAVSTIGHGENAGRTLEEFNIVRAIRKLGSWKGQVESFSVPVSSLPADATDVAVLVQPFGQAPIIGAAAHPVR
jgi:hypothetical protein